MHDPWTRRSILAASLAGLALPNVARGAAFRSKAFRLQETAGLRRFGFPVHTIVPDIDPTAGPFVLKSQGKSIPAQFRAVVDRDGKAQLALDFNASPGPEEVIAYEIIYGEGVEPVADSAKPPQIERDGDALTVRNGLIWKFRARGAGLLDELINGTRSYVSAGSLDAMLMTWGGLAHATQGADSTLTVTRTGPFAVGLRHESTIALENLGPFRSTIDITLPSSKSWVEIDWRVDDPQGKVERLSLGADLKVGDGPTLIDFGASSTVYHVLKPKEATVMMSGRRTSPLDDSKSNLGRGHFTRDQVLNRPKSGWSISKFTPPETSREFATGQTPAQGWAHVMDQSRCTAIGLEGFENSRQIHHHIRIDGTGNVSLSADPITPTPGTQRLHAWYHFVPMPVQVGALTSPQSMMNPLQVVWSS